MHAPVRIRVVEMNRRRAACEPCRESKQACDHQRPACGRCSTAGEAEACRYREQPFKRKRRAASAGKACSPPARLQGTLTIFDNVVEKEHKSACVSDAVLLCTLQGREVDAEMSLQALCLGLLCRRTPPISNCHRRARIAIPATTALGVK